MYLRADFRCPPAGAPKSWRQHRSVKDGPSTLAPQSAEVKDTDADCSHCFAAVAPFCRVFSAPRLPPGQAFCRKPYGIRRQCAGSQNSMEKRRKTRLYAEAEVFLYSYLFLPILPSLSLSRSLPVDFHHSANLSTESFLQRIAPENRYECAFAMKTTSAFGQMFGANDKIMSRSTVAPESPAF